VPRRRGVDECSVNDVKFFKNHRYKNFFTQLGRRVVITALLIREHFMQPSLVWNTL
jgi:hypothetical protein